ncbi:MAG: hypothetical protein WBA51_08625 [Erythrobacter sp.]
MIEFRTFCPAAILVVASIGLASCTDGPMLFSDEAPSPRRTDFSQAEREAAQSLSPLANPVGQIPRSRAEGALLCALSVETVAQEMEKAGMLSTAQASLLDRAIAAFATRAQDAFVEQGLEHDQIAEARAEFIRNAPGKDKQVRESIVCLREIQNEL